MQTEGPARFRLEVHLMDDPCLWRWDITDAARNAVIQSSWDQEWTAYPSREEAVRAGRDRLTRFTGIHHDIAVRPWRFGATE